MTDRWNQPPAVWMGDALTDLHDGKGTSWVKTDRGYYPDCDCHRPEGIARSDATRPQNDPRRARGRKADKVTAPTPETPAEAVIPADELDWRILATWLRKLLRDPK